MAKKSAKPKREQSDETVDRQAYIPGTEPPEPPEPVAVLRDSWLKSRRQKNKLVNKTNGLEDELYAAMVEHDVPFLVINAGKERIVFKKTKGLKTESNKPAKEDA